MRIAVVDLLTNFVVNTIVADVSDPCPDTLKFVASETAQRGWLYDPATDTLIEPTTDPVPSEDGPFEISPGQLRNRLPLQACTWFRVNYSKPDTDQTKNQTAATVWERILNSNTINVRSASVQTLGALVLAWNVDGIDAGVMAHVLAPVRYDGETSTGLMG